MATASSLSDRLHVLDPFITTRSRNEREQQVHNGSFDANRGLNGWLEHSRHLESDLIVQGCCR